MTDCMVCVYYRVDAARREEAIAAVRELQRGIAAELPGVAAELLLRSDHPTPGPVSQEAAAAGAPPSPSSPQTADPTLMETYRLDTRTLEPGLDAFLDRLAGRSRCLAPLLRGDRHVEVFRPCAS